MLAMSANHQPSSPSLSDKQRSVGPSGERTLMLAAVEPSGDALGAKLMDALAKETGAQFSFCGCGGPQMAARGFESAFNIDQFSVMGFTDVARVLPAAYSATRTLTKIAQERRVDGVVFIDGWAFSRLGAKAMKKAMPELAIYKYAAPQIWASRPQRIDFVRQYFDGVMTLLPFEPEIFEHAEIRARFVGNPVFQEAQGHVQQAVSGAWRAKNDLNDFPVLAVLPGSRAREVSRLAPIFVETIERLRTHISDLAVIIPAAPAVSAQVQEAFGHISNLLFVPPTDKYAALIDADVALAASGTVTTEIALCKTPQVIAYRVDPLTELWARRTLTTQYASILNVMADAMVIPEQIQQACTPDLLEVALLSLLTNPQVRDHQVASLAPMLDTLTQSPLPASEIAAQTLISWMGQDLSSDLA